MAVSTVNFCFNKKYLFYWLALYSPPVVECNENDTLVINVYNQLDTFTALHSHGMFQNNTAYMDGPVGVTQW